MGRSYGDAASLAGGVLAETSGMNRVLSLDAASKTLRAEAGASLDKIIKAALPLGLFVPVTPGTRQVSLGGAIAADIHGKNHHVEGSFGRHVRSVTLSGPTGTSTINPATDPELFWATVGGMGLTGVVVQAEIAMIEVETSFIRVDTERARNLDEAMSLMQQGDAQYRYSVAWIDCLARGGNLGRAVLTRGDHASIDELSAKARNNPLAFHPRRGPAAPGWVPSGLLNRFSVAAFNEAWYRKAPKRELGRITPLSSFFHPLDGVRDWNRLYGPRGFLQYQFVVPFGAEDVLRRSIERLSKGRFASFLAVLKRFGDASPAPLSFPMPGWTLALDIPISSGELGPLLDSLDEDITAAGGRTYLAKDSRLPRELLARQYPRLEEWRTARQKADPEGMICSDLCRRLDLAGHH